MRKLLSLIISAASVLAIFAQPLSVSAVCMMTYPTIGTISSVSSRDGYSTFALNNVDVFDAAAFGNTATNLDTYNTLAKGYISNGYAVPSGYVRQFQNYEDPAQIRSSTRVMVPDAALAKLSYKSGDVVIMGPPGGASCMQFGFVGVFGTDGIIKSAAAYDNGLLSYTYGPETLSLTTAGDFNCSQASLGGTQCETGVTYSLNGQMTTMNAGDTRQLGGTKFSQVSLIQSNHTTLPNNMMMEDFSPRALIHVLTFANSNSNPPNSGTFVANPSSGQVPLNVTFTVSGFSFTSIDFGDGSSMQAPMFNACAPGTYNCNVWSPTHTYNAPGSFTVRVMNGSAQVRSLAVNVTGGIIAPPPSPVPPSVTCPIILRTIGRGARGSDVFALQSYFISIGVLGNTGATGYFGPLTEGAVQEWQASHGLISFGSPSTTGWGVVGPRTRAMLAHCAQ